MYTYILCTHCMYMLNRIAYKHIAHIYLNNTTRRNHAWYTSGDFQNEEKNSTINICISIYVYIHIHICILIYVHICTYAHMYNCVQMFHHILYTNILYTSIYTTRQRGVTPSLLRATLRRRTPCFFGKFYPSNSLSTGRVCCRSHHLSRFLSLFLSLSLSLSLSLLIFHSRARAPLSLSLPPLVFSLSLSLSRTLPFSLACARVHTHAHTRVHTRAHARALSLSGCYFSNSLSTAKIYCRFEIQGSVA